MAINYHFTESCPVCVFGTSFCRSWQSGSQLIRHLILYYRVFDTPACIPCCISSTPPHALIFMRSYYFGISM